MRQRLEEIGHLWIEAWNSRDLERVLSLYDERAEMVSGVIIRLGINPDGRVLGKSDLRAYWARALETLPNLHFTLLDLSVSPDSVIVRYVNERGSTMCEYLRVGGNGKIIQGSANHLI
jgi:predicted ester cyclase